MSRNSLRFADLGTYFGTRFLLPRPEVFQTQLLLWLDGSLVEQLQILLVYVEATAPPTCHLTDYARFLKSLHAVANGGFAEF